MVGRRLSTAAVVLALGGGGSLFTASAAAAQRPAVPHAQGSCKNGPGVSDTGIKVGGIIPTSGPGASSFAAAQDGIEARFAKANAEGELGKRKLTFVVADDAADPARNLTAAQDLVEQQDVFGAISVTNAADSSAPYLNKQGIPVTGWHVANTAWGKYKNMFGFRNSFPSDPATTTTRNGDALKKLGGTKVALIATNVAASATVIKALKNVVKKSGLKVVYLTTDLTRSDRDFTAVAQKIKDSGADAAYTGMDFLQNVALNQALNQAGVKLKAIVFPGGYDKRAVAIPGLDGAYFSLEFAPFELGTPAFKEYQKWMTQTLPDKPYYGQVPYVGWLSADAFIEGLKAAGTACPTRKAFIKNLRKEKGYTANGAFMPVDFAKVFGKPVFCTYYVRVQNGAFVPQFGGQPICPKAIIQNGKAKKLTPAAINNS